MSLLWQSKGDLEQLVSTTGQEFLVWLEGSKVLLGPEKFEVYLDPRDRMSESEGKVAVATFLLKYHSPDYPTAEELIEWLEREKP